MSAHTCTTFDPTCYRCDLNRDELSPPYQPPVNRRLAAFLVKVLDPITGWFLHAEARLERYAEGWR